MVQKEVALGVEGAVHELDARNLVLVQNCREVDDVRVIDVDTLLAQSLQERAWHYSK